jgi:hypothetical protein
MIQSVRMLLLLIPSRRAGRRWHRIVQHLIVIQVRVRNRSPAGWQEMESSRERADGMTIGGGGLLLLLKLKLIG